LRLLSPSLWGDSGFNDLVEPLSRLRATTFPPRSEPISPRVKISKV
jgi:hypothetical protein